MHLESWQSREATFSAVSPVLPGALLFLKEMARPLTAASGELDCFKDLDVWLKEAFLVLGRATSNALVDELGNLS